MSLQLYPQPTNATESLGTLIGLISTQNNCVIHLKQSFKHVYIIKISPSHSHKLTMPLHTPGP